MPYRKLQSALTALLALLAAGAGGASFLTWVRSGERNRNSFEVVQAAETLNFLDGWGGAAMANIWYAVPLFLSLVLALIFVGQPRWAARTALPLSLVIIVASWKVMAALPTRIGPKASLTLGAFMLVTAATMEILGARVTHSDPG